MPWKRSSLVLCVCLLVLACSSLALAEPKKGDTWRDPVTGMEFVWVPRGCFQMGSPSTEEGRYNNEGPVHEACVDGFWMGKYEVTQGQWKKVMKNNPSSFQNGDDYPVEKVSWNDAQEFIKKLQGQGSAGIRLPTEAEWEYACRSGGKPERYCGGNSPDGLAWYAANSGEKTHQVGTKSPNGLGLYDMSGNVWELVQDVYDEKAYQSHARQNPIYTGGGSIRVFRGGSWNLGPRLLRSARRNCGGPSYRDDYLGLRLLRTN